jgi:hypothetical protein
MRLSSPLADDNSLRTLAIVESVVIFEKQIATNKNAAQQI